MNIKTTTFVKNFYNLFTYLSFVINYWIANNVIVLNRFVNIFRDEKACAMVSNSWVEWTTNFNWSAIEAHSVVHTIVLPVKLALL